MKQFLGRQSYELWSKKARLDFRYFKKIAYFCTKIAIQEYQT